MTTREDQCAHLARIFREAAAQARCDLKARSFVQLALEYEAEAGAQSPAVDFMARGQ